MAVAFVDCEVHVYWQGNRVDRVAFVYRGVETEIPLCTEIRRVVVPSDVPKVDVRVIGRLIEHRES